MFFNEDLLSYLWKYRLYDKKNLSTADGSDLKVISPGTQNHHAGPDIQNAKLQIGETIWAGNIEIHIRSSDWLKHGHHHDQSYNNVILHVVYTHDEKIINQNQIEIPVLILENLISPELLSRYQNLIYADRVAFPCENNIRYVDKFTVQNWLDRMLIERLEEKSAQVKQTIDRLNGNWKEAFYQILAANFGFKINALPFELLAKSLPLQLLAKHHSNLLQTEALLFGQAGFLDEQNDEPYFLLLQKEYQFLKHKYNLLPIEKHLWKFLRLRPLNFPTVRLAQFAALLHQNTRFLAEIIKAKDSIEIKALFIGINPSNFWQNHYHFGKTANFCSKKLGQSSIENILINTISTFLFTYGKVNSSEKQVSRAIKILENLPCENNYIISSFISAGIEVKSAAESQAVIELKTKFCDQKRCLECGIGNKILNSN